MEYRMKQSYLDNYFLSDTVENERYLVEDITNNVFNTWNDKLEVMLRLCDYFTFMYRFYKDGRIVLQMACENTMDSETEWTGHSNDTHFEYESLDSMLADWSKRLKDSEDSAFAEEIKFIENMKAA